MMGVEEGRGGGHDLSATDNVVQHQNGITEKAPVVAGTNMETLPRPGKQSDPSTAFLRAARAGQLEKVLEFLESGVDINASNSNGLNALHLAAKDGHLEIVRELLTRGATVDAATKKGNTALHIASLAGQEEVVQLLVQRGASVNAQSQNGFTPLYMAAQENHDSVVKFLLSKSANQTLATEDGFTPLAVAMQQGHDKVVAVLLESDTRGKVRLPALHIAAKKDDCKAAALLLQNDHNPDVTSKSGFTPLHIAAHYGNDRIASLLYDKGADVNFAAKHNITPMHVAAKWGKIKMVNLLMSKGANIAAKTRDGLTPLHCAARAGHHEVVDILIEKGAPIGSKTKNGLAPLHMASQGDHVDAARILLYHRAPVDEVTVDYLTALHVAAHCGHVRVAKLLLDRNADPNARALNGFTPLHIACKKNRIKVVELLLKHKASIEATTESGLTPLHVASFMGCMNIVIYLLQNEASPDIPTVRGETPLHLAARANQTDIIRILLRNGAQVDARAREEQTPLHVASRLGNVDIVMLLLQHGADVDATTKDLYTPLHIAAKEGQEEVASVLLENGASLTATTKKGFTPLHLAAKYGNMNVARLLLLKNAPVDAQGKNGVTPLHVASHYDHQNVALLLLDKGASPHAMAKNGHTPLHIAARKNQMDIATTLLEYGAKANAESKAGFTPLHLSAQEGHTDMSTLLIEHKADTNHKAKNGLTPLHLCAQEDKTNVAAILVKNSAQVDAMTKAGYTPLHVAAHFGQAAMVRFLLRAGAAVDSSTGAGYTPLHQAAQQGHTLVINLLLESKAKPNAITNNGQTALAIAQKLGYISVVETLKVVTETIITTTYTITIEEKYKVQAPESMQETFMSDSEDEGGGDEIGMAAMNVYGQPPHAQHVYLPSYYQGQMTYTREDPMLSDQQQYRYMTVDDMKSMGDDSMRVNVTDDERDNRHSGGAIVMDTMTKDNYQRSNAANLKPDNVDIHRHPVHVGPTLESLNWSLAALGIVPKGQGMWRDRIPHWRNFLVSFLVDARGGAMRGCRHSGVRVIVPPRKAAMPMRVTCRYLKRDKLTNPPPLMEGEALASRILELGPVGAKFLGPVIIEVPHFASLRGKEREIVILRSDNGETWREHTLEASEEAVQDVLNESFEGEELSQLEDLQTSRIVRILTVDFPHYFAVVSRIRQEVHAVGPEGGTVSSSAVAQVQAVFPPAALTKKIRVGLQAHPIPAELVAKLLGNRVAVSPIVTVEPRRRKFHKPITLTIPVPQAANKGMINQYSGDAPTLRLLCSITGGQSRAVWEDVTGSTPLTFVKDCVSFTTTVSARFWLMDCRNITEATRMATELYTHATHVPFMAKFVVFAKRVDPLEARLRVFCMTDDKEDKTLEHQEHFTEVAKSRDVEVLEGKTQYMEFAGNLVPVMKSGEQLQLPFRAFKENRVPFTARIKDPDAADMVGRIMFMSEPKVAKGEPPQSPICTLNILLPEKISPETGHSELDLLELSKNYSFLRDGGISRPDTIHRATIRLTDIANLLDRDWEKLAEELNVLPVDVDKIKTEHPGKPALQAAAMFKLWQSNGNKATGNKLEKALNKIGREDIVKKCIFNVELVTDDVEKAVARVRLDQPGFDSLKEELGPSRDSSLRRDGSLADQKRGFDFDEPDRMRDSESVEELSKIGNVPHKRTKQQHITITNGTVFNGTSTPIKDKYASEEKDIGDDMAEFLEHKCLVTDTMTKRTRDESDDDNKNRQRVIEDANRLVSGVIQDAEKEKEILAMEGLSGVYCDTGKEAEGAIGHRNNESLIQNIESTMLKEVSDRGEESVEPLIKKERIVIDDSRGGKVFSQTIITTSKSHPDSTPIVTKTTTIKETLIPSQTHFFGAHDPIIGAEILQQQSPPTKDVGDVVVTKTIIKSGPVVEKKTVTAGKSSVDEAEAQMVAFGTNVPTDRARVEAKGIARVAIDPETMSAHDKCMSEKEKLSREDKEVANKTSKFMETKSKSNVPRVGESKKNVRDTKLLTEPKKAEEDSKKSAYDSVYNVPSEQTREDGKKKSGIFSGIFKAPKLKKAKSKDSKETSFDSGDEDVRATTREFIDDTKRIANQSEHRVSSMYPEFDSTKLICICPAKLPEEEPRRDPIWATADFLYDSRRSAEAFIPGAHESVMKTTNGQSESIVTDIVNSENKKSELRAASTESDEHKEKNGFFSNLFKATKKAECDQDVTVQHVKNPVDAVDEKIMKNVDDIKGKSANSVKNGIQSAKDAVDEKARILDKTKDEVDTAIHKSEKTIDGTKKSICSEIKFVDADLKHVTEEITSPEDKMKHSIETTEKFGKTLLGDNKQAASAVKVDVEDSIDEGKAKSGGFFGIFKSPKSKDKRRSTSKDKDVSKDVSFDSGDEELRVATAVFLDDTKRASDRMFEPDTSKSLPHKQTEVKVDTFVTSTSVHSDVPKDKIRGSSYIVKESSVKNEIPTTIITTKTITTIKHIDDSKDTSQPTAVPEVKPNARVVSSITEKLEKKEKRKSSDLDDSADEAKQRSNGFFGIFKSPKLKSKKKSGSRDRSTSKEPSFDSGDEELRQATSKFLEDTRKTAEIIGSSDTPRRKSLKDSVKAGATLNPTDTEYKDASVPETHSDTKTKDQDKGGIFGIFKSPKSNVRSRSKSKEKSSSTEMAIDIADEELRIATAKFLDDTKNVSAIMEEYPYPSAPLAPDYENEIKMDSKAKENAKDDDKTGKVSEKSGFLSGIFKGAKHAVEEVTEDVKEFWDETKEEAKEEETKTRYAAEEAARDMKDIKNKASADDKVIKDEVVRNNSHSKDQAVDTGEAMEKKIREDRGKVCADTAKLIDTLDHIVQKDVNGVKVKETDGVKAFATSVATVKQKAEIEDLKVKDEVSGTFQSAKHAVDGVYDDVKEFWDETKEKAKVEKETTSRAAEEATRIIEEAAKVTKDNVIAGTDKTVNVIINSTKNVGDDVKRDKDTAEREIEKDAQLLKGKITSTTGVAADSAEEMRDKTEKEAKKVREKSKGFFSGIFKGVKYSTDEAVDDVKKLVDDTKKEVEKKEDDVKLAAKDVKDYYTSGVMVEKDKIVQKVTASEDVIQDQVIAGKDVVTDTVKATGEKISIGAAKTSEYTEDAIKKIDHVLKDDTKLMKEKATDTAEVIIEKAESAKDKTEKETKRAKEKSKGFFSGLFKGVKHVSDEVVADVKDFVDETKAETLEEEERVRHAAEIAAQASKDSTDKVVTDIKAGVGKIADDVEKVRDEAREKMIAGQNVMIDTVNATGAAISDATSTTAQVVQETVKKIDEDGKAAKDAFDQEIKKDKKIISDKLTGGAESIRDSAEATKTKIEQEAKAFKDKTHYAGEKIAQDLSNAVTAGGDTTRELTTAIEDTKEAAVKGVQEDTKVAKEKVSGVSKIIVDSVDTTKHKAEKEAKKVKEKSKGLFSGIFKGAKHAADKATEDTMDIVYDTKKEAQKGEERADRVVKEAAEAVKNTKDKTVTNIKTGIDQIIDDTENAKVIVVEKLVTDKDSLSDTSKSTGVAISNLAATTSRTTKDSATKLNESLQTTGGTLDMETRKDTKFISDRLTGVAKSIGDCAEATENTAKQQMEVLKDKAHDTKIEIIEEVSKTAGAFEKNSREVAKSIDNIEKETTKDIKEDIKTFDQKVSDGTKAAVDSTEAHKHKIEKDGRKTKEKSKGFFSGIFKGSKHSIEETIDDSKDFLEEIRRDASDQKAQAIRDAEKKLFADEDEVVNAVKITNESVCPANAGTIEGFNDIVKTLDDDARKVEDAVDKDISIANKIIKEEISKGAEIVATSVEVVKDVTEKEAKKGKTKAGGFFSGIFKGAKQTIDDVPNDVKHATNETNKEIENTKSEVIDGVTQDIKDVKDKVATNVEMAAEKISTKLSDVMKDISDTTGKAEDIVDGKLMDGKETTKSTGAMILETSMKTADAVKGITEKVGENIEQTKNVGDKKLEKNVEMIKQKLAGAVESVDDTVELNKKNLNQEGKALKIATNNAVTEMGEAARETDKVVDDKLREVVRGIENTGKTVEMEMKEDIKIIKGKVSDGAKTIVDSTIVAKHKTEKEAKKAKERGKGFFSGIFKGGKQVSDEVTDDVKEFLDVTKREAAEEEDRARRAASETAEAVKNLADKATADITAGKDRVSEKITGDIEGLVDGVDKMKDKTHDKIVAVEQSVSDTAGTAAEMVTDATKVIEQKITDTAMKTTDVAKATAKTVREEVDKTKDAGQVITEDAKFMKEKLAGIANETVESAEVVKIKVEKEAKKAKEKSSGFFSGIVKGVKHAADEVAKDVKDFVDETKKEALLEEERIERAAEEAAQVIKDAKDSVAADVKSNVEKVVDDAKKVENTVQEKLVADENAVPDTVKSTGAAISASVIATGEKIDGAVAMRSKATKDVGTKINEDITEAGDAIDKRIKTDTKRITNELTDIENNVSNSAAASKTKVHQQSSVFKDRIDEDAAMMAEAVDDKARKITKDVGAAKTAVGKGLKKNAKTVSEKISEETKAAADSVEMSKNKSEKDAKKVKETGKSFFSGLFKGVKHAGDQVTDDVADFVDETKKEAREDEHTKHAKEKVADAITDVKGRAAVGIKTDIEQITDAAEKVKNTSQEKIVVGKNAVTAAAKSTASSVSDAATKTMQTTGDTAKKIAKESAAAKDTIDKEIKKDTKLITDKLTGAEEVITDSTKVSEAKIESEVIAWTNMTQDAGDKIADGASVAAESVDAKVREIAKDIHKTKEMTIQHCKEDVTTVKLKMNDGVETMVNSATSAKEKADKEAKKVKETGKGFFAGLFKGVKHAADEVADDIKDFVDETKKEALEEEEQAKRTIGEAAQTIKDRKDKATANIETDVKKVVDVAEKVQGKAQKKLMAGKDAVTDITTSTASFVSDAATKAVLASSDTAKRVAEEGEATKDDFGEEIKKEAKLVTDKLTSVAESITDRTKAIEDKIKQEAKALEDTAQDASEKIAEGASKTTKAVDGRAREIVKDVHETTEATIKEVKDDATAGKEKITNATKVMVDSAETIKNKAEKEIKKTKEKGKGLFSGIFKSAKHTADNVTEDVNDFVDETKKSAQEEEGRAQRTAEEVAQAVKGAKDEVFIGVKAGVDKIADSAEAAKDNAQERMVAGKDAVTHVVKSTGAAISDAASNTTQIAKMAAKKVGEDVIMTKDAFDSEITQDVKLVMDKLTGTAESITDSAKAAQSKLDQEAGALKKQTQDAKENITMDVSKAASALDDKTHEITGQFKDNTMAVKETITDGIKAAVESTEITKYKTEKDIKKVKEKGKGLFSGIFKGAKHTADKVTDDFKDIVDNTTKGVELEEEKARRAVNDAAKFLMDAKKTASADIETLGSEIAGKGSQSTTNISEESKTGGNGVKETTAAIKQVVIESPMIISENPLKQADQETKKTKETMKQMTMDTDKMMTHAVNEVKDEAKSMHHETAAVIDSADSNKHNAEKESEKHKEISSGFFSNIIQNAKHAVDEISDEVNEFWDETKAEAKEEDKHAHKAAGEAKKVLGDVKKKTTKEVAKISAAAKKNPTPDSQKNIYTSVDDVVDTMNAGEERTLQDVEIAALKAGKDVEKAYHKTGKEAKKAKDKTSGMFFGILKGTKHASDETTEDVQNFIDEAKREASEEITRVQKSAQDLEKSVKNDIHSSQVKAIDGISSIAKDINNEVISAKKAMNEKSGTGKKVDEKLVQKTEKVINITKDSEHEDGKDVEQDKLPITKEPKKVLAAAIDSADVDKHRTKEVNEIKDKSSGFLSGIIKGAKHVVEEVSEDVKEFWDETKVQAKNEEQQAKRAAEEASKDVKDVEDRLISDTQTMRKSVSEKDSQIINDVTDNTTATMDQAPENLTVGKNYVVEVLKTTGHKIGESADKAVEKSKDAAEKVGDDISKVKVDVRNEVEKDINAMEDKITDVASAAVDSGVTTIDKVEKEIKKGKDKSSGMFFGIFKSAKRTSDEMADEVEEFLSDTEQDTKKATERALNAAKDLSISGKDVTDKTIPNIEAAKANKDSLKKIEKNADMVEQDYKTDISDIKTNTKKMKEKSGGYFSGIIKGAKHAVGEVSEEVKEFLDETKDEAKEEEKRARREAEETTKTFGGNKTVTDLLEDEEVIRQQMTADLERAVQHSADSPIFYTEIPLNPRPPDTVPERHVPGGSPEKVKSSKGKSKGVISSLVKGAKTASHKIVKEVDHATENIKDATEKFWEDTKHESTEYNVSGSYDVSSPLRVSDPLIINKQQSDIKLESFGPLDKLTREKSPTDSESRVKSMSRIPQKISPTKELKEIKKVDEVKVVRFEGGTSSTSIDKFDDSNVANKLGHLEPRARQSVTTVITKSVRTATASPPPSPDEFGDITIKDVTEEATKRAQSLADQGLAAAKPGHDSTEIEGTVERHVTSAPTKQPVPAPRHSAKSSSSSSSSSSPSSSSFINKREFTLELDANHPARHHSQQNFKSPKSKIPEPTKVSLKSQSSISSDSSCVDESSQKSRIPVKTKEKTMTEIVNKEHLVTRIIGAPEISPNADFNDDMSDVVSNSFPVDRADQTIHARTVTKIVSESVVPKQLDEFLEITKLSQELIDLPMGMEKLKDQVKTIGYTAKIINATGLEPMPLTKSKDDKQREISEENTSGTIVKETMRSISTKSSWESSTRSREDHENWDQAQFSMDTSPGSGETGFAKNGDSRHDLPSDSDSEGSPRPTRRSLSKRRTIGSSSGSDVALHEGAELSPLEDDQESDFLQHSEPSYVETTTTEYDPETNERITRTTRTMTSSESMGDGTGESDELRESMQKIVDQFMTEERRAQ